MMIILEINFQKFFGIIRQVSGPNDHPTPTFLQLYRMLSVYSVIKQVIKSNFLLWIIIVH